MTSSSSQAVDLREGPNRSPDADAPFRPFAHSTDEVIQHLGADERAGLSTAAIEAIRARAGWNELPREQATPAWLRFARQFGELVVWILIAAAIISGALGEWIDTLAIGAIVLVNGVLGFLQEERAEKALASLQQLSAPMARVRRDGQLQQLPARELVPGDCVEIEAGDNLPADCRLLQVFSLQTQEAALTGESLPLAKQADARLDADTPLAERRNMLYLGTIVTHGRGMAVVTAIGLQTELGKIAGLLAVKQREPTPLERRLDELGRVLIAVCLVIVTVIFALEMLRGGQLSEVFLRAVSLAVAAVPEGLPAVVTISLALGLERMVRRHALVRKLPSVETLGSVTVVCSDKTGTLTRNEMTVQRVVAGGVDYDVSGVGYEPRGAFRAHVAEGEAGAPIEIDQAPDLRMTLAIGAICNSAHLKQDAEGAEKTDSHAAWRIVGDPTEGALLVAARKAKLGQTRGAVEVLDERPFDSQRKAMSVVWRDGQRPRVFVKGAPEVLLPWCDRWRVAGQETPLDDAGRGQVEETCRLLADDALRVLAMAYRDLPADWHGAAEEVDDQQLVLAGVVGMLDPPRDEVRPAMRQCRAAGIRPIMITGDHPVTARAIARRLEMLAPGEKVLAGAALDGLSDAELKDQVDAVSVYARVTAEHKLRVVRAWRARNQVVAMTGDGVNDAPAVREADIGIAMGITGTDVTKGASDMVLTDDNFTSIVAAIEEGRGIFENIQKFVQYLLACNTGEVLFVFSASVLGWPAPLTAVQLLWINLVTDGLPALALAMERPEPDLMQRPPRPPREPVITRQRGTAIAAQGSLIALTSLAAYAWMLRRPGATIAEAQTMAFAVMAFSQLGFALACRSFSRAMPQLGLFSNRYLLGAIAISAALQLVVLSWPVVEPIFDAVPLAAGDRLAALLFALIPVSVIETYKLVRFRQSTSGAATG